MAVSTTFKQQCPSCEAMITIKEGMVGKKVECTKCKDKFVAEKPVDDEDVDAKPAGKKDAKVGAKKATSVTSKVAPAGKRPKLEVDDDDVDEVDDIDEVDEEPVRRNGKAKASSNGKAKKADEDNEEDDEEDAGDAKKKGKRKLTIGLALAGVGVVILVVAAVFVLNGGVGRSPAIQNSGGGPGAKKSDQGDKPPIKFDDNYGPVQAVAVPLTDADRARLSNLLPGDSEHVFRAAFKDMFDVNSVMRAAVFESPGGLDDAEMKRKLGFSVLAIDDMLCAERFTIAWRFTVLHFKDVIKEADLKTALKLKTVGKAIDGQVFYKMTEAHPWFDQLSRLSFGIPNSVRALNPPSDRPTFVRLHTPQTLIIADQAPMEAFLKVKGKFPSRSTPPAPPSNTPPSTGGDPKAPMPGDEPPPKPPSGGFKKKPKLNPGGAGVSIPQREFTGFSPLAQESFALVQQPNQEKQASPPTPDPTPKDPNPGPPLAGDAYMTINPELKKILDRMESRGPDGKDKVLLSSATDMSANRYTGVKPPEFKYSVPRMPRQFWDVTLLLNESEPHIQYLGTALVQRDTLKYRLRNEIICGAEIDAADINKQLHDRAAKSVARFLQQLVGHEVRLVEAPAAPAVPPPSPTPPPPQPGQTPEKKPDEKKLPEPTSSQIMVTQQFTTVDFVIDLLLDNSMLTQARAIAGLNAAKVRLEIEAAAQSLRHQLAASLKAAGEKGLSQRQIQIPPGQLPPGAFERLRDPDSSRPPPLRIDREPKNRVSFMAGLLPYLGQQNLLDKIRFDQSWRDPGNWMAGSTVVPQFLDPTYPYRSQQVAFTDLPVDFAATHYVGIAGVGLDAASYKHGDPATRHLRGAFSYDQSATFEEIAAGRGVSNTILMIQVPHDSVTGVSPWIAGGGATLRGVPEKNSIAPFISANHDKKRGTFAMMADGSVRYIDQSISDEAFKAMCTIAGPAPANLDEQKDANTQVIPAPAERKGAKEPDKKAPTVDPPKKEPEKKPGVGKKHDEVKSALQGDWIVKSMEMDGKQPPAHEFQSWRFSFQGDKLLTYDGKDVPDKASAYAIDPSKVPMHIDVYEPGSDDKPVRGIIEITKDELKICMNTGSNGVRPTAFATQPGSRSMFMVLTRKK